MTALQLNPQALETSDNKNLFYNEWCSIHTLKKYIDFYYQKFQAPVVKPIKVRSLLMG